MGKVLPMGFKHSVRIAHTATRQLLNYDMPRSVYSEPYIDNVRFVSDNRKEVVLAAAKLCVRAAMVGVTVNEVNVAPLRDIADEAERLEAAIRLVEGQVRSEAPWLGEQFDYVKKTVEMAPKTRTKVENLFGAPTPTFRNVAAQFAMLIYASRTYGVRLGRYFAARRAHAGMSRLLTARPDLWDKPAPQFCPHVVDNLRRWRMDVLEHPPRVVRPDDADIATLIVDASSWGWGAAYVDEHGREFHCNMPWSTEDWFRKNSVYAEPLGAYQAICRFVAQETTEAEP